VNTGKDKVDQYKRRVSDWGKRMEYSWQTSKNPDRCGKLGACSGRRNCAPTGDCNFQLTNFLVYSRLRKSIDFGRCLYEAERRRAELVKGHR
jgi:hypothetical protein